MEQTTFQTLEGAKTGIATEIANAYVGHLLSRMLYVMATNFGQHIEPADKCSRLSSTASQFPAWSSYAETCSRQFADAARILQEKGLLEEFIPESVMRQENSMKTIQQVLSIMGWKQEFRSQHEAKPALLANMAVWRTRHFAYKALENIVNNNIHPILSAARSQELHASRDLDASCDEICEKLMGEEIFYTERFSEKEGLSFINETVALLKRENTPVM